MDKINPRDMIVHRVINIDDRLPTNYFREKYKNYLKPSLLYPKQYYQDLLNQRYYSLMEMKNNEKSFRRDFYSTKPLSKLSSDYRPLHFNERQSSPVSFASISTWNQCVQRLNTEYRLTIDALEQAKQCLKQMSFDLQRLPPKNVDFIQPSIPHPPISPRVIKFAKPKLIKPVELQTFIPSTELTIDEDEPSITTYEIPKSCSMEVEEEETTYTVETFYTKDFSSVIEQNVVVIQEKTTEEQFNSVPNPPKKSVSFIPKPIPRTKPPPKINSPLNKSTNLTRKIKPPSKSIRKEFHPLSHSIHSDRSIHKSLLETVK